MENDRPYWLSLGISADPFTYQTSDQSSSTMFSIPEWQQELELLQHMVQFSHVMMAVTGQPEVGKATFAQQLLARIGDHTEVMRLDADSSIDSMKMLQQMTESFRLSDVINCHHTFHSYNTTTAIAEQ